MDVAQRTEMVEAELTRLIERRHDQRVKAEGVRAEHELWAESEQRHRQMQRRQNVAAWFAHFCQMADNHRALCEHYERRAEKLCEEGE